MNAELSKRKIYSTEVAIEMIFEAPREVVYNAFIDPEYLMQWWGPKEFTAPTIQIDPIIGGKYLFCMRDSEGRDTWSTGVIKELVDKERIVYTDSFSDPDGNPVHASYYGMGDDPLDNLLVTITFEEVPGGSKVTLRHASFPSSEMAAMTTDGWTTSLEKLNGVLKREK
jgi:uncharacterized protein YndB with AHSA1/START domain